MSHGLIGASRVMARVRRLVDLYASTDAPVLITGESGSGKEVVARALWTASVRARGGQALPFVAVNCGGLPAALVESELFGHERGAFTGAHQKREGAFASANGGILFLDEIGELPLSTQPTLLRALENGEVRRVGSDRASVFRVRMVAATHRRLIDQIANQQFREDLYHRLAVLTLEVPPLRERLEDLPELVDALLAQVRNPDARHLTAAAWKKLARYDWPGNVRELRNTLTRATVLAGHRPIDEDDIVFIASPSEPRPGTLGALRDRAIRHALDHSGGNKKAAARTLGISRSTLHRRLARQRQSLTVDEAVSLDPFTDDGQVIG